MQLMKLIPNEEDPLMKESLMGALSSFLRSQNYEAKLDFLENHSGLKFIQEILLDE